MQRKYNSTQIILLILVVVFTILNPSFLSPFNLYNFLMQNEYRIVMITGLAIIMLGGEIDLSLGYQISLVGILIGKLLAADIPVPVCILAGLAAGCCCGLLNGFLIAGLNLSSVIVTLITQKLFQGISYLNDVLGFPSVDHEHLRNERVSGAGRTHYHDSQHSFSGRNVLLHDSWKKYSFHGI